ncbi:hypothetical protein L218DRAFT_557269 [Marasmius fiardii PR-910]|nr:hypothetical protein L218DRAFT_557269 [Marasmius fiardii PR-910]
MESGMDLSLVGGLGSRELPQELIDGILNFLRDDQKALRQCCLASRSFQPPCQKLIFECIRLHSVVSEDGGSDQGKKFTMAQRLRDILVSSLHLAPLIKELRIMNTLDESGAEGNRLGWLEQDTSLPVILPLLVNLERFYLSGVSTYGAKIDIESLPRAIQDALFLTWKSPNLTRIGLHRVRFATFEDLFSVILHSPSVRDITLCYVIFTRDDEGRQGTTANVPGRVCGKPISPRAEQARIINSLSFYGDGSTISSRFFAALLSNMELNKPLSALRKLFFPIGVAVQNDLSFLRQFLRICPALEELHISMCASDLFLC